MGAGLLLTGLLGVRIWALAGYAWSVLHYPYPIDYDEGVNLHAAWLLSQGQPVYAPFTPDRFVSALYTPLYYFFTSIPLHWSGPALESGRLIALASAVGIAVLLGLFTTTITRWWPVGLLAGLFFLALSPVYVWANLYKQDMLAVFFTIAGLYAVQRFVNSRFVYTAAILFGLAFFTKQTALVGPATACLYLVAHDSQSTPGGLTVWQSWRRGLMLALSVGAAIAIPFAALDLATDHNFWIHIMTPRKLPWTSDRLVKNLTKLTSIHPYLIALAAAAAAYFIYRRRFLLLPIYLSIATAAIIVANGYRSANYNMLLDIFPPLCLLAAALVREAWKARKVLLAPVGLFAAVAILLWQGINLSPQDSWYMGLPSPSRSWRMGIIENFMATSRGPILSEDVGTLLLAGKETDYDDPYAFSSLARLGAWDDGALVAKIQSHYFTYIVLNYDITGIANALRWSPEVLKAMQDNYEVLFLDTLVIYKPKGNT